MIHQNVSHEYPIDDMFSFGFSNGAQHPSDLLMENYCAVTTSYDFDAPITEFGDPTQKFMELRDVIGR